MHETGDRSELAAHGRERGRDGGPVAYVHRVVADLRTGGLDAGDVGADLTATEDSRTLGLQLLRARNDT